MKKYLILFFVGLLALDLKASDENINVEDKKETIFEMEEKEQKESVDKYEEEQRDYSFIKNNFYEGDSMRIYNNTAYRFDGAHNKFMAGQASHIGIDDFAVSFGYGMEFKLDPAHKVGYEYVSNFPYDRGQVVRFFWSKRF